MKFSAANIEKQNLNFSIEAPWLAELKKEDGNVQVKIPHDPSILSGMNILIAVVYSGESGEEYANYQEKSADEWQVKFVSGIVKVIVASTPQAFATNKVFAVYDKMVLNM